MDEISGHTPDCALCLKGELATYSWAEAAGLLRWTRAQKQYDKLVEQFVEEVCRRALSGQKKKVKAFLSHVNVYERLTLTKEDFNK